MSKELKMKVFSTLALAISMAWGMSSCQADCGKSSPPPTESAQPAQPCEEVLPQPQPISKVAHQEAMESSPYDFIPLPPDEEQYEYVSLAGLTFHPERYDGKKVRVSGYLTLDFERETLCDRDLMAACLWVAIGGEKYSKAMKFDRSGERVFVRGVFDANMRPYGYDASIKNIVEISGRETMRFVFDGSSDRRSPVWTEKEVLLTNPIIADPARHDGKVVLVYGYIPDSFDGALMCPSMDLMATKNCIGFGWRIIDDKQEILKISRILKLFRGKRAYIRGVFDASDKGLDGIYSGSIVKFIEIYEENGPVRFKFPAADCGETSLPPAESTESVQPCGEISKVAHQETMESSLYDFIPLPPDEEQYEYVSLAGLTFHPERYDGKKVRVSGYLTLDFDGNSLCDHDPMAACLWVDIGKEKPGRPRYSRILKFNHTGKRVFVRGVFHANMHSHWYDGGIKDIVEISGGKTMRFVFDDPSNRRSPVWTEEEILLTNPIIADPERHNGEVVLVYGYISDSPFQMCPSVELNDTGNCIGLLRYANDEDDEETSRIFTILTAFSGKRAYVRGVFDASNKGLEGTYSGSIVKFIEIYEENGPVRFQFPAEKEE